MFKENSLANTEGACFFGGGENIFLAHTYSPVKALSISTIPSSSTSTSTSSSRSISSSIYISALSLHINIYIDICHQGRFGWLTWLKVPKPAPGVTKVMISLSLYRHLYTHINLAPLPLFSTLEFWTPSFFAPKVAVQVLRAPLFAMTCATWFPSGPSSTGGRRRRRSRRRWRRR